MNSGIRVFFSAHKEEIALAVIALTALSARLYGLNHVDFYYDTGLFSEGTVKMIEASDYLNARAYYFVDHPTTKSYPVGPLFFYLLAPPFLVSSNPVSAAFYVAVFNTAAVVLFYFMAKRLFDFHVAFAASMLYAVSPWSVLFSTMPYNYSFMQFFAVLYLFSLMEFSVRRESWYIALSLVSLTVLIELSQTGLLMVPALIAVLAVLRPRLSYSDVLVGVLTSFLLLTPHLYWESQHHFHDVVNMLSYVANRPSSPASGLTLGSFAEYAGRALSVGAAGEMERQLGYGSGDFNAGLNGMVKLLLGAEYHLLLLSLACMSLFTIFFLVRNAKCLSSSIHDLMERRSLRGVDVSKAVAVLYLLSLTVAYALAGTPDNRLVLSRYYIVHLPALYLLAGVFASEASGWLGRITGKAAAANVFVVLVLASIVVSNILFLQAYHGFLSGYGYPHGWLTSEPGLPYVFTEAAVEFMRMDSGARGCRTFTFSDTLKVVNRTCATPGLEYTARRVFNLSSGRPDPKRNIHYFVFTGRPPRDVRGLFNLTVGPYTVYPEYAVNPQARVRCV